MKIKTIALLAASMFFVTLMPGLYADGKSSSNAKVSEDKCPPPPDGEGHGEHAGKGHRPPPNVQAIINLFDKYDKDGNGQLSDDEIAAIKQSGADVAFFKSLVKPQPPREGGRDGGKDAKGDHKKGGGDSKTSSSSADSKSSKTNSGL